MSEVFPIFKMVEDEFNLKAMDCPFYFWLRKNTDKFESQEIEMIIERKGRTTKTGKKAEKKGSKKIKTICTSKEEFQRMLKIYNDFIKRKAR
jgi:hypothetical protein